MPSGAVERRFRGAIWGNGANLTFSDVELAVWLRFKRSAPRSGKDADGSSRESEFELGGESSSSWCRYDGGRIIIPGSGFVKAAVGFGVEDEEGFLDSTVAGPCRAMYFWSYVCVE